MKPNVITFLYFNALENLEAMITPKKNKKLPMPVPEVLKGAFHLPYLFDKLPWAVIKFFDLENGRLFEVGAYSRLDAY